MWEILVASTILLVGLFLLPEIVSFLKSKNTSNRGYVPGVSLALPAAKSYFIWGMEATTFVDADTGETIIEFTFSPRAAKSVYNVLKNSKSTKEELAAERLEPIVIPDGSRLLVSVIRYENSILDRKVFNGVLVDADNGVFQIILGSNEDMSAFKPGVTHKLDKEKPLFLLTHDATLS